MDLGKLGIRGISRNNLILRLPGLGFLASKHNTLGCHHSLSLATSDGLNDLILRILCEKLQDLNELTRPTELAMFFFETSSQISEFSRQFPSFIDIRMIKIRWLTLQ